MSHRFLLPLSLILMLAANHATARDMSVQVREGQLRSAPSYLSRILQTLPYTQRVTILETSGDWLQVQPLDTATKGWMHQSSLTRKKLALSAGDQDAETGVSTEEQALAGKGFNAQVEKAFKQRNEATRFDWVDRMENLDISIQAIQQFLKAGGLVTTPKGGDA